MNVRIYKKEIEIRFAGAGGQGLQAAATVLGKSLILSTEKYVCQSQNYGPESRGGLSYSDLIISDEEIDFPKIRVPDVLVCMSNESFHKFRDDIQSGSMSYLIIDPEMIDTEEISNITRHLYFYRISATLASEHIFGSRLGANIVLVGALHSILKIGNQHIIEQTLADTWPRLAEKNILAFRRGLELAKKKQNS